MSNLRPLKPKIEHILDSSALPKSAIITLPAMAANIKTPPQQHATSLPCEPRFMIRLADDQQGNSRWTAPDAYYFASIGSSVLPPLHRASLNPHVALRDFAAYNQANNPRPTQVVANAPQVAAEVETQRGSPIKQGKEVGEEDEDEDAPGEDEDPEDNGPDPDTMPHVGAACSRCRAQQRRCNQRRPCQHCLRDGVAPADCITPPEASPPPQIPITPARMQQYLLPESSMDAVQSIENESGQAKRKRESTPDNPPARAAATPGSASAPSTPTSAPTPSTPSSSASRRVNKVRRGISNGGRRVGSWIVATPKATPPPFLGNFPTDEQKEAYRIWEEKHPNYYKKRK